MLINDRFFEFNFTEVTSRLVGSVFSLNGRKSAKLQPVIVLLIYPKENSVLMQ